MSCILFPSFFNTIFFFLFFISVLLVPSLSVLFSSFLFRSFFVHFSLYFCFLSFFFFVSFLFLQVLFLLFGLRNYGPGFALVTPLYPSLSLSHTSGISVAVLVSLLVSLIRVISFSFFRSL